MEEQLSTENYGEIRRKTEPFARRRRITGNLEEEDTSDNVSTQELIDLIQVLSNGYIKPDVREGSTLMGVRDTKRYFPIIDAAFEVILKRMGYSITETDTIINKLKYKQHD